MFAASLLLFLLLLFVGAMGVCCLASLISPIGNSIDNDINHSPPRRNIPAVPCLFVRKRDWNMTVKLLSYLI